MYRKILKNVTDKIIYAPIIFRKRILEQIRILSQDITIHSAYHHRIHFQSSASYLFLGYIFQCLLNKDEAKKNFKLALFQDPYNEQAESAAKAPYKSVAYINIGAPYLKKIFHDYQNADKQDAVKYVYSLAIKAFLESKYQASLDLLMKIFYRDKGSGLAYLLTGVIYLYKHNYKLAQKYLEHSIEVLQKQHDQYHKAAANKFYKRALLYYALKEFDLSCNDLTKTLDLNSAHENALILRAKIYIKKKEFTSALKDLEQAKEKGSAKKMIEKIREELSAQN